MPCRYDEPTGYEYSSSVVNFHRETLDRLTKENDMFRELIIKLMVDPKTKIPANVMKKINAAQTAHRKEDLARLEKTFTKSKDAEKLALVWAADPTKELQPQLGFSADEF